MRTRRLHPRFVKYVGDFTPACPSVKNLIVALICARFCSIIGAEACKQTRAEVVYVGGGRRARGQRAGSCTQVRRRWHDRLVGGDGRGPAPARCTSEPDFPPPRFWILPAPPPPAAP